MDSNWAATATYVIPVGKVWMCELGVSYVWKVKISFLFSAIKSICVGHMRPTNGSLKLTKLGGHCNHSYDDICTHGSDHLIKLAWLNIKKYYRSLKIKVFNIWVLNGFHVFILLVNHSLKKVLEGRQFLPECFTHAHTRLLSSILLKTENKLMIIKVSAIFNRNW